VWISCVQDSGVMRALVGGCESACRKLTCAHVCCVVGYGSMVCDSYYTVLCWTVLCFLEDVCALFCLLNSTRRCK